MIKLVKNWTLPLAMLTGIAGAPLFTKLYFLTPYLIFAMLLLTFCKVALADLRPGAMHGRLLLIQVSGALGIYFLLAGFDKVVAESVMVCIICPTATSAAVITGKLGGNPGSLTTYTLLSNTVVAIFVPLFFPLIEPHSDTGFHVAFLTIFSKIFPLLICPFLLAYLLKKYANRAHAKLAEWNEAAFYLWALSLTIVTAKTFRSLLTEQTNTHTELWIALGTLIVCCLQFFIGKTVGSLYADRISGGQALGQKNTVFAIWMAHTYLNPLSAVGPGLYVLWQNVINSWQLWKKRRKNTEPDKAIRHNLKSIPKSESRR